MTKKPIIVIIIVPLIVAVILYFSLFNQQYSADTDNSDSQTQSAQQTNSNNNEPVTNDSESPITNTAHQNSSNDEIRLWHQPAPDKRKPFPRRHAIEITREYINFHRSAITALKVNDVIPVFIPQSNRDYIVTIEKITVSDTGNKSYIGALRKFTNLYRFIMTQGKDSSVATLQTPEGEFVLEAIGEDAWIYDQAEFDSSLDFSETDVIDKDETRNNK